MDPENPVELIPRISEAHTNTSLLVCPKVWDMQVKINALSSSKLCFCYVAGTVSSLFHVLFFHLQQRDLEEHEER
jgi:hypothetical protein